MAIRPGNLVPQPVVRQPDDQQQVNGNIVNPPTLPQFGGAKAVMNAAKQAPYGRIVPAGRKGSNRQP